MPEAPAPPAGFQKVLAWNVAPGSRVRLTTDDEVSADAIAISELPTEGSWTADLEVRSVEVSADFVTLAVSWDPSLTPEDEPAFGYATLTYTSPAAYVATG